MTRLSSSSAEPCPLDGLVEIGEPELRDGVERNILPVRDEVSPFSDLPPVVQNVEGSVIVDTLYGHVFGKWARQARGLYGIEEELPAYAGDGLADLGFLRVPYRRVPRVRVRDRRELDALTSLIVSADPDLTLLFRGQAREYLVDRSSETREVLFGNRDALEPSLLASAARQNVNVEAVYSSWCALLNIHFDNCCSPHERVMLDHLRGTYNLRLMALAIAQHYGLPSMGLDVTDSLGVAAFFALHSFNDVGDGRARVERVRPGDGSPVLYLLTTVDRFSIVYSELGPPSVSTGTRPAAQAAQFLHTGWGFSQNAAARRLFMALYLDPAGDFEPLPTPYELFPADDPFGHFLEEALHRDLPNHLRQFVARFRGIITD